MELTPKLKSEIDAMSYGQMLSQWRFAPVGDPMFAGESGEYFGRRMKELRNQPSGNATHVAASKAIGW